MPAVCPPNTQRAVQVVMTWQMRILGGVHTKFKQEKPILSLRPEMCADGLRIGPLAAHPRRECDVVTDTASPAAGQPGDGFLRQHLTPVEMSFFCSRRA